MCNYVHQLYIRNHQMYKQFSDYFAWQRQNMYGSTETDMKHALIFYNDTICQMSDVLDELKRVNLDIQAMVPVFACSTGAHMAGMADENVETGFAWINELCLLHRKYNGPEPCTAKQMLRFFQSEIEHLNDNDFYTLTHNIEYHLGNTSLRLIEQNLRHFIVTNYNAFSSSTKQLFDLKNMLGKPRK